MLAHYRMNTANIEWVKTLGGLLLSWPVVGFVALIIFRKPLLAIIEKFTGDDLQRVKVGNIELERKLKEVEKDIDKTKEQIAQLYALSMSEEAFDHLKTINDGSFKAFYLDPELKVGLALELNYLKVLGYILFDKVSGVGGVEDLPKGNHDDDNLSKYISVTKAGKDFIKLREETARDA